MGMQGRSLIKLGEFCFKFILDRVVCVTSQEDEGCLKRSDSLYKDPGSAPERVPDLFVSSGGGLCEMASAAGLRLYCPCPSVASSSFVLEGVRPSSQSVSFFGHSSGPGQRKTLDDSHWCGLQSRPHHFVAPRQIPGRSM